MPGMGDNARHDTQLLAAQARRRPWMAALRRELPGYLEATGIVIASIAVAYLVRRYLPHASLSLVFLTGVLIVSARAGLGPSLYASLLSFEAFNYLFTPPYYTFEVADHGNVATLVFFLLVAAIAGNLAARMRREIEQRRVSLERISNLQAFSREMVSATRAEEILAALVSHLERSTGRAVVVGEPPADHGGWLPLQIGSSAAPPMTVAIRGDLEPGQIELARNLCEQASVALDRTRLVEDLEEARVVSETERLRSALLSSVSHDLRTPLASIIGSATSLAEYRDSLSPEDERDLLGTVIDESRRLDRYIQNLLDMTRLGEGRLALKRDWVDLHDIVSSARQRLAEGVAAVRLEVRIGEDVPLLWVHGALLEQAFVNVLDNAINFSPARGRIMIAARREGERVCIEVCDQGPGIPDTEREKIFDMFYTVRHGDRRPHGGTGLGLAICRGMIGAHGGSIEALDGPDGCGTCMRITLPIVVPAAERVP